MATVTLLATADFYVQVPSFSPIGDACIAVVDTPKHATADVVIALPRAEQGTGVDTIFLQHDDGSVESISVAPVVGQSNKVTLASPPAMALAPGTHYTLVRGTDGRERACLVTEKGSPKGMVLSIKAINYDRRYYTNDEDFKLGYVVDEV